MIEAHQRGWPQKNIYIYKEIMFFQQDCSIVTPEQCNNNMKVIFKSPLHLAHNKSLLNYYTQRPWDILLKKSSNMKHFDI